MATDSLPGKRVRWFAVLGSVFVLPAILVPLGGAFRLDPSSPFIHLAFVVGGLLFAFGLNAMAVIRLRFQWDDGSIVGVLRVLARWPNIAVVLVSAGLAASLLGYAFLENFRLVAR